VTGRAWVPIDAWLAARSRPWGALPTGTWRRAEPEPDDCPRCGGPLRVAHAYAADGAALRHLETYRTCAAGCPGDLTWEDDR